MIYQNNQEKLPVLVLRTLSFQVRESCLLLFGVKFPLY